MPGRCCNCRCGDSVRESSGRDIAALFATEYAKLERIACDRLGADLGDDVAAESFARLLAAMRVGTTAMDDPTAYLYRICYNLINDIYRQWRRHGHDLPLLDDYHGEPFPYAAIHARQTACELPWQSLPVDQRTCVILYYLHDWDITAIAAYMQRRPGAVKALIHRGMDILRGDVEIDFGLRPTEHRISQIREYLSGHGPASTKEIARYVGLTPARIYKLLKANDEFVVVGDRPARRAREFVWGIV